MKARIFGFTVGALIVIGVVSVMAMAVWSWLKPKAQEAAAKITGGATASTGEGA